jgi:hypothetical protein
MKKLNIDKPSEILQKAFDDVCTKSKQVGLSIMFIQEWDTPALGFLGVAAAEDTVAYTIIFTDLDPNSTTCSCNIIISNTHHQLKLKFF